MSAPDYAFTLDKGATFRREISKRLDDGTLMDFTGKVVRMTVRDKWGGSVLVALSPDDGVTVNPTSIVVTITDEQTAALTAQGGVYDIDVEDTATGDRTKLLRGNFFFRPGATLTV